MPWFKVDDKLHDHRKPRQAGKAAMGVWILAGSWCADNLTDGFIPASVLSRWGTKKDAQQLVTAGLWEPCERDGEQGWLFHDWIDHQPPAADVKRARAAASGGGRFGNHLRWHKRKGVIDPDCEYCKEDKDGSGTRSHP